jgi:hypothetical protein
MWEIGYIELLEKKCKAVREELRKIIKAKKEDLIQRCGDLLDPFLKFVKAMLTFLFFYIGNDKDIILHISANCPSIIGLIQDVIENKSKEIIHPLNESASSINLMLNPEDNDEEG